jgi:hypothetical protein
MDRCYSFQAGAVGTWKIESITPVIGDSLPWADRLTIHPGGSDEEWLDRLGRERGAERLKVQPGIPDGGALPADIRWQLRGVVSNERYVTRGEKSVLREVSPPLGRPAATCAALIPITKSESWWNLSQDERREILEAKSRHIATGLKYLPAVARRLHHGRDLGEPFDFVTWFEYTPSDAKLFEQLVAELRRSEEWNFVEREVDVRLVRDP